MMDVQVNPGKYVVAVSGGVDSMVLLHVLAGRPGVELVVAHYDHGARPDSGEDAATVRGAAEGLGLEFVCEEGHLGHEVSEAAARAARYVFLRRAQERAGAQAIITAHHQDDVLETALLNLLRGTGRKGLTSLASTGAIVRPLLHVPKEQLRAYAQAHRIAWREDSTNLEDRYVRNRLRRHAMPRLDAARRAQFVETVRRMRAVNAEIDTLLAEMLDAQPDAGTISRQWFTMLPYAVACEVMAAWLRRHGLAAFSKRLIHRVVAAACTAQPGKQVDLLGGHVLLVARDTLRISDYPLEPSKQSKLS